MTTVSITELNLIVKLIRNEYLNLEHTGKSGTEEHKILRSLEDKLGALNGDKFNMEKTKDQQSK